MSTDNLIRKIVWENSFERRRRRRQVWTVVGLFWFGLLTVGAALGIAKMWPF